MSFWHQTTGEGRRQRSQTYRARREGGGQIRGIWGGEKERKKGGSPRRAAGSPKYDPLGKTKKALAGREEGMGDRPDNGLPICSAGCWPIVGRRLRPTRTHTLHSPRFVGVARLLRTAREGRGTERR